MEQDGTKKCSEGGEVIHKRLVGSPQNRKGLLVLVVSKFYKEEKLYNTSKTGMRRTLLTEGFEDVREKHMELLLANGWKDECKAPYHHLPQICRCGPGSCQVQSNCLDGVGPTQETGWHWWINSAAFLGRARIDLSFGPTPYARVMENPSRRIVLEAECNSYC